MSRDKIKRIKVNQTIQINSLNSPIMKGTELDLERNPDILKILLNALKDKDISSDPSDKTLATIIEMIEDAAPVKEPVKKVEDPVIVEKPKSDKKTSGSKKSGKKKIKKGDN